MRLCVPRSASILTNQATIHKPAAHRSARSATMASASNSSSAPPPDYKPRYIDVSRFPSQGTQVIMTRSTR